MIQASDYVTPTAVMAAIGNATKHGFLVREGDALERLAKVNKITFDKTGTLTYGTPVVTAVKSISSFTDEEVYAFAASAEKLSEHPLGKAIVKCYGKEVLPAADFHMELGEGVTAVVEGKTVRVGNQKLLNRIGLSASDISDISDTRTFTDQGSTVIFVAVEGELTGYIVLSDTLRDEVADMIQKTKTLGITPVLLTGDHAAAAAFIAGKLGITEVTANCLPEDKLASIDTMQKNRDSVCMIGDGINDAPALKKPMSASQWAA